MYEKFIKVLIIDDDQTTGFQHKTLLEKYGVSRQVEVTYSGEEAIQLIEHYVETKNKVNIPQLTFVDLNLPFMDGFEYLEAYQNLDFKTKESIVVSVLTGSFHPEDVKRIIGFSVVDDYIVKPFTEEKVVDLMHRHFGWHAHSD